jgi:hypothetical protein
LSVNPLEKPHGKKFTQAKKNYDPVSQSVGRFPV